MASGSLGVLYKGPSSGRLPAVFPAVILGGQPALDPPLADALFRSFGESLESVQLVSLNDTKEFSIEVDDPTHPRYRPFFFDRKKEYGTRHRYWEALCHTQWFSVQQQEEDPSIHFIETSSARYADRLARRAIGTRLVPATLEINAFVDALRAVNLEFLEHLRDALARKEEKEEEEALVSVDLAQRFIDGVWRNCAVQFHFGGSSRSAEQTLHLDHINSSLHMAVTLNGSRTVAFVGAEGPPDELIRFEMKKGDVYLTTPTAILHGIGVKEADEEDRSVALQLRTLLSVEDADALERTPEVSQHLFKTIQKALDLFQGRIRMPTWAEWDHHRRHRLEHLQHNVDPSTPPGKAIFRNVFLPPTKNKPTNKGEKEEGSGASCFTHLY